MPTDDTLRRVGTFTAVCLLVSNAVGSGIFTTTGFLARDLGSPGVILALWAAGAALSLAGALSYAELGAALPRVGGEYVYLRRAFGPLWGFLSGWTSFTLGFGGAIAASAMAFAAYLHQLLPGAAFTRDPRLPALALVWLLTGVHALGTRQGGRFQVLVTVLKIGGIAALCVAGLGSGQGSASHLASGMEDTVPSAGALAVGLVFVLYSFSGWNAAAYIAGEMRRPERSIPRAMIAGTLFVGALYLLLNLVYFYALPASALAAEPVLPVAEKAASALLGPGAGRVVVGLLCLSIAGASSSMVWAGPRVTWAMARDGVLPVRLGQTTRSHAPLAALLLQAAWISALVLSGTFEQLVIYAGVALALFSAAAVASVSVLRWREPELPRPFRVRPHPWVPLAYVAASLWIAAHAALERPIESLLSLATVALGVPLYRLWARRAALRRIPPT
jgi:APA family basic amino acid/polyamine antiporter